MYTTFRLLPERYWVVSWLPYLDDISRRQSPVTVRHDVPSPEHDVAWTNGLEGHLKYIIQRERGEGAREGGREGERERLRC